MEKIKKTSIKLAFPDYKGKLWLVLDWQPFACDLVIVFGCLHALFASLRVLCSGLARSLRPSAVPPTVSTAVAPAMRHDRMSATNTTPSSF